MKINPNDKHEEIHWDWRISCIIIGIEANKTHKYNCIIWLRVASSPYGTHPPVSEAKYERAICTFDVFMFGIIHERKYRYSEPISSKIKMLLLLNWNISLWFLKAVMDVFYYNSYSSSETSSSSSSVSSSSSCWTNISQTPRVVFLNQSTVLPYSSANFSTLC